MTAHGSVGVPYPENPFLRRLVRVYLLAWIAAGIAPADRVTWLLENGLVLVLVVGLAASHRRFVFSNVSYALIFVFLLLHALGAHYTYSAVPIGEWLGGLFGTHRNHYDRFVHFAFGLLLGYPLREVVLRIVHIHRAWSYVAPPVLVLAQGAIYEIIESWAARLVDPGVGLAFVGAQGDVWDGQKDMTLAFVGSLIAMAATAAWRRVTGHEPYQGLGTHTGAAQRDARAST